MVAVARLLTLLCVLIALFCVGDISDMGECCGASKPPRATKPKRTRLLQWIPTDADQHRACEKAMLQPIEGNYAQRTVAGLNTIIARNDKFPSRHTVLIHGFAGGVGQWVPNWNTLSKSTNLYAIDLPGFGRSIREEDISFHSESEVIAYYVDCFDRWFQEMELDGEVNIVGHSFGAYLASFYVSHRPERIRSLVLADPWGVPRRVTQKISWKFRVLLALGFKVGNPLSVLRGLGPWGPKLLPKARKDFLHRWSGIHDDPWVFYDYTYHSNAHGTCVGERAFAACADVDSGLYARRSLVDEMGTRFPTSVRLQFVYGAHTWMDRAAGRELASAVSTRGGSVDFVEVSDAGHQVNVDNYNGFNAAVSRFLFSKH